MSRLPLRASAAAKINLALVVGPRRADGLHEVATVMQRISLADAVALEAGERLEVGGFTDDTLVTAALRLLAERAGVGPRWRVRLVKRIPLAAGLGGGSADAAAALVLANSILERPLPADELREVGSQVGADVPFFLEPGPKLAEGAGERLTPLDLPQDYWVVVAVEAGAVKRSTREVYARFDELGGGPGFEERRARLLEALAACRRAGDLADLPANDLAEAAGSAALLPQLRSAGALRADVSGAGPAVYGLFPDRRRAEAAAAALPPGTAVWVARPVW